MRCGAVRCASCDWIGLSESCGPFRTRSAAAASTISGLEVLGSSTLEREQVVELFVVAASPEQLRAVEQRHGSGMVRIVPALAPAG